MRTLNLMIAIGALLTSLPLQSNATGVKVIIVRLNGQEVSGELLLVTDSILVISKNVGLNYEKLRADSANIFTISREEIAKLTICGKSYLPDGLLLGGIFGIGVGTLMSYEPHGAEAYNSNFDPFGPGSGAIFIGLAGGMALGAFVGVMASTTDQEISLEGRKHIVFLNEYSRYYERSVPDFVQKFVR